ncbi:FAD/NAD(P)-binding domain-containing protein [Trichoderma citrinoviride]|uniref:FAD/NAD(P)-binding domain-containing protein n=1 Tax=Trichoderma citrinoviride TaxID=58853 RepID=A0A2T4B6T3_9HYPO|nr:FAD/NAD(P)-binding domain-containing protein [Trichoderma citrinoviride]PTB64939.1 FAD/NAD(P)-binding domain-containing protein [Trichoderma citrinoviride]
MTPSIAIIGAGPCGLTLARLLECKGIEYVVYERDESDVSNRRGGSLDIHAETGQRALKEAGLFDEFKKHARYDDAVFTLANQKGERVFQAGQDRDAPEIDRVMLRQILLNSIPNDRIRWNHALRSITLDEDGHRILQFSDGNSTSGFKLVIGADGAWSKVRPSITQARPQYSGNHYIESRINSNSPYYPTMVSRVGAGTLMCLGSSKEIVTQRQGDGSYRIYLGVTVPEDFVRGGTVDLTDTESTRRLFLSSQFFGDWADDLKDLIRYSDDFRSWPLYFMDPEAVGWKSVPGMTLAGDAAHLATPNGEGVNCAMQDALVLASKIATYGAEDLCRAVAEYEEDMFRRGAEHIRDGLKMAAIIRHEDGPAAMISFFHSAMASAQA